MSWLTRGCEKNENKQLPNRRPWPVAIFSVGRNIIIFMDTL